MNAIREKNNQDPAFLAFMAKMKANGGKNFEEEDQAVGDGNIQRTFFFTFKIHTHNAYFFVKEYFFFCCNGKEVLFLHVFTQILPEEYFYFFNKF